jgi:HEAT repeat protein
VLTESWVDYLTGPWGVGFAFAAGVISFLSPCVLPLVPAYIAHLTGVTSEPEVLLMDVRHYSPEKMGVMKFLLFQDYGIESAQYEHIWDYEQYCRIAEPGLEAVRAIGAATIPHLLAWLQPPFRNPLLPAGATSCFKALGPAAASAIPQLAKMLQDSMPPRSSGAYGRWHDVIEALSYLGPEALPILLSAAANNPSPEFQADVIHNLGNFGPDGAPAIPALIAWSRHEDLWIRFWAIHALGRIAQQPAAVIPVLLSALKDSEAIVRREAAQALGRYGKAASHAVSELLRAADDADWHAQPGAIAALALIGEQPDVILPLLVRKLHDGNWILRRCAAVALGDFGGQKAFDALIEAADDPQGFVREIVFQSLKMIDPAALEKSGRKFKTSGLSRG